MIWLSVRSDDWENLGAEAALILADIRRAYSQKKEMQQVKGVGWVLVRKYKGWLELYPRLSESSFKRYLQLLKEAGRLRRGTVEMPEWGRCSWIQLVPEEREDEGETGLF